MSGVVRQRAIVPALTVLAALFAEGLSPWLAAALALYFDSLWALSLAVVATAALLFLFAEVTTSALQYRSLGGMLVPAFAVFLVGLMVSDLFPYTVDTVIRGHSLALNLVARIVWLAVLAAAHEFPVNSKGRHEKE